MQSAAGICAWDISDNWFSSQLATAAVKRMAFVNFPPKLLLPDEDMQTKSMRCLTLTKVLFSLTNQLIRVFCCLFFARSVEADARLLGILNEQYDDRDTLISEISREVRHLVVCFQCVRLVLFSQWHITVGIGTHSWYQQFRDTFYKWTFRWSPHEVLPCNWFWRYCLTGFVKCQCKARRNLRQTSRTTFTARVSQTRQWDIAFPISGIKCRELWVLLRPWLLFSQALDWLNSSRCGRRFLLILPRLFLPSLFYLEVFWFRVVYIAVCHQYLIFVFWCLGTCTDGSNSSSSTSDGRKTSQNHRPGNEAK